MRGQRTSRRTGAPAGAAALLAVAVLARCGTTTEASATDPTGAGRTSAERRGPDPAGVATTAPAPSTRGSRRGGGSTEEDTVQIEIQVGDERFTADVDDSPAGRDLLAQLPQTVAMGDHGGVEKTGRLQRPLSLAGRPAGADPEPGDLGYYAPDRDLVLYHGDQSFHDGIVVLGSLDADAASRLAELPGDITASVTTRDP